MLSSYLTYQWLRGINVRFKVGYKVKVKEEIISKLQASRLTKMASAMRHEGVIINSPMCPRSYLKVQFSNGAQYYVNKDDLELTLRKNQQLLFDFMD